MCNAPYHTDLMVTPESLDVWLAANPLPTTSHYRWKCEQPYCGWEFISKDAEEWEIDEAVERKVKCQVCGTFLTSRPTVVDPA